MPHRADEHSIRCLEWIEGRSYLLVDTKLESLQWASLLVAVKEQSRHSRYWRCVSEFGAILTACTPTIIIPCTPLRHVLAVSHPKSVRHTALYFSD